SLILLSATPHDGSARSFASLMSLLDPTAISDPDDYTPDDFKNKGLVVRRFKKDIRDQVSNDFQDRQIIQLKHQASPQEEEAYQSLLEIPFTQKGKHNAGKQQELQRVAMQKAIFSSPHAALDSTLRRIRLLSENPNITTDEHAEVFALQNFEHALKQIDSQSFSKFQCLVQQLKNPTFGWNPADPADRLVVFSERIETLNWLLTSLTMSLKLKQGQIEILHGGMPDTEQQNLVERFGRREDPLRVMLCSDVASEGLNLHYFCHRLVHFDLPWSLMVFQQRNGRVDRYGQTLQPQILYLFTETKVEKIRGDLRILKILQTKDEQAYRNLGDPASFLHVYDPEKEAEKISELMAAGITPETFEASLEDSHDNSEDDGDFLASLFEAGEAAAKATQMSSVDSIMNSISLFSDDYAFAATALKQLSQPDPIAQFNTEDATQMVIITAPVDLQERLKRSLPVEVRAVDHRYTLCASKDRMIDAIETARQAKLEEESWPQLHYLWPQHPVMIWLLDRVITAFGRHRAPVIRSDKLATYERAFILAGLIPNRKGQPLLVEWKVAVQRGQQFTLESFETFVTRAGLGAGSLPNRGDLQDTSSIQAALPSAVEAMKKYMVNRQTVFDAEMRQKLSGTLAELQRLQTLQMEQLELRLQANQQAEQFKRTRRERRTQQIHKVFDEYRQWVEDTMTTEPQPFIQVLAGVIR
ncbi:MAG: DEAD/DEAH box helicase, partial [SAR324 cluster bacterium]|nr:DEAD/DEAH box helicase [SAR324 cluster bacterium]